MTGKRILIVDDEEGFTVLLKLLLEDEGYPDVLVENDALRAEQSAREYRPDVILLDLVMPGRNGDQIAQEFASDPELSTVPIVFLSGLASDEDTTVICRSAGNDWPVVPKPFERPQVLQAIETALSGRTSS